MRSRHYRESDAQKAHDTAVQKLAETRFALDSWDLTTNVGERGGDEPDIVAICGTRVVAIGEVETKETVCEQEAAQWRDFGQSCPRFYLFVPEGTEGAAAELLDEHGIACAGLRCYSESNGDFTVRSVPFKNGRCPSDDHPWWQELGRGHSVS